ncbi:hypothetical protein A2954_06795 [Candidatus Roizmanbacteria bacterium RIFCSPLOWO2_01_FULL_37_12]|uniref:Uncharacterized protein n=1 Tax=Candidatus Roizmanbacteria bacterium RIFCSPLOWO2_01_FULL_37_12 TaxID=1802056 RepID=A0A1F7ID54_9BACT|nr:MAG: hypothetical protein A3D76_05810 [Candidatus Roizmanbacteria bacterium RIFCSPHIGHO2_02_FULL_37_9b]OGK41299.1 MAG: hypothetical protein A2954_06795 [Candidatus Roizmanbacteria bacterium RIFCSPLOWO2_01_FULL_37_12]
MSYLNNSKLIVGNVAMDLQRAASELYTNNDKLALVFLNHATKAINRSTDKELLKIYKKNIVKNLSYSNNEERIKISDKINTLSNILLTGLI